MLFFKSKISLILNTFVCLQAVQFASSTTTPAQVDFPDLYEASISELQAGLDAQHFSSVDLVKASLFMWQKTGVFLIPAISLCSGIFCSHWWSQSKRACITCSSRVEPFRLEAGCRVGSGEEAFWKTISYAWDPHSFEGMSSEDHSTLTVTNSLQDNIATVASEG